MSAHTPGPWAYDANRCAVVASRPAAWNADNPDADNAVVIATYGAMGGDDTDADIRLIVAAPDLLEALENLENDDGSIPDHAWQMVQSAIALAGGRTREATP